MLAYNNTHNVQSNKSLVSLPVIAVAKKNAQLSLTNPRDAKACQNLLQFDVKTSCRQANNSTCLK